MGKRGPPPKPSKQKKLEGTFRKDRAARNELAPPAGVPERPSWLSANARAEWDRVVPQLAALGILAVIDRGVLVAYCTTYARWEKAQRALERGGKRGSLLITAPGGALQRNPLIKIADEALPKLSILEQKLGLSPSSRSRISAPDKDEGLSKANERMKDASKPGGPAADQDEAFLFGPRLVKAEPAK